MNYCLRLVEAPMMSVLLFIRMPYPTATRAPFIDYRHTEVQGSDDFYNLILPDESRGQWFFIMPSWFEIDIGAMSIMWWCGTMAGKSMNLKLCLQIHPIVFPLSISRVDSQTDHMYMSYSLSPTPRMLYVGKCPIFGIFLQTEMFIDPILRLLTNIWNWFWYLHVFHKIRVSVESFVTRWKMKSIHGLWSACITGPGSKLQIALAVICSKPKQKLLKQLFEVNSRIAILLTYFDVLNV